ncbi:MAG: hypothetical protein AB7S26_14760 [Sandaracinaceae bacterium]
MITRRLVIGATFFWLAAQTASADVLAPPPASCPEGSTPVTFCHGPETCEIAECTTNADCGVGQVCAARALCVRTHCCSGRGCGLPTRVEYTHVAGPCTGGTCTDFDTACEQHFVCVSGSRDAGTPRPDAGRVDAGGPDHDAGGTASDGGGTTPDGGGTASDGGGTASDGGSASMDGGGASMDGGGAGSDAGGAAMDSGSVADAGESGGTDGGCCSVVGRRSSVAPWAFGLVLALGFLRRRARA